MSSSIKTTQIDGDISVGRNIAMGGNAHVAGSQTIEHNLVVKGWLKADNVIYPNKGFFSTLASLQEAYPEPQEGDIAAVGTAPTFTVYNVVDGEWTETEGTIDLSEIDLNDDIPEKDSTDLQSSGGVYSALKDVSKGFMTSVVYKGTISTNYQWEQQVNIPAGCLIVNSGSVIVNLYSVKDSSSDLFVKSYPGIPLIAPFDITWIRGYNVQGDYEIVGWTKLPTQDTPTENSNLLITSGGVFGNNVKMFDIRTYDYTFVATISTYRSVYIPYDFVSGHRYIGRIIYPENCEYRTYLSIRDATQDIVVNNICEGTTSRYFDFTSPDDSGKYLTFTCAPAHEDNVSFFVEIIDITNESLLKHISLLGSNWDILQYTDQPCAAPIPAKEGWYIKVNGTVGSSTNWYTTGIFELKAGQTLSCVCKGTSSNNTIIALSSTNNTATAVYTPVEFGTTTQELHSYSATEDCYVVLQYFFKTGDIVIYNDSKRMIGLENDIDEINKEISDIKDSFTIPSWVDEETERVYRYLLSKMQYANVMVAFQTDQHIGGTGAYDPKYATNGIKSIVKLASKLPLDFIVSGGDITGYGAYNTIVDNILDDINVLMGLLSDINTRVISIPGNHDAFQNNDAITSLAMYNAHFKRSLDIHGLVHSGIDNCDSYIDDESNKIRYIFIDLYSRNPRTESYSTFLTNALAGMGENYNTIIFSHAPLTNEFNDTVKKYSSLDDETGSNAFSNAFALQDILNPYASRIIACICGHSHTDAYGVSSSGILYIETTSAVHTRSIFRDGDLIIPYEYVLNSRKETSYDIFVIDMSSQTIEAVRYGQGSNRKWKYKGAGTGLISYTNCVYGYASVPNVTLVFQGVNSEEPVSVTCDANGYYEVYLDLGATYTISCEGYTLDTSTVEVLENTELDIALTINN